MNLGQRLMQRWTQLVEHRQLLDSKLKTWALETIHMFHTLLLAIITVTILAYQ